VKRRKPAKTTADGLYYFDEAAADRVCQFFETYLRHSKGEWAGKPFRLEPWQRDLLRCAFGTKRVADGLRRYRKVYVEVPRKNGKSTLAAGVGLYLTLADSEHGAEVYSAAADRQQASIVFDEAKRMVNASPGLKEVAEVYKKAIFAPHTNSGYQAIASLPDNQHGLNAHGIIFDELHVQPSDELYNVLSTSMGARRQPMFWMFTTAGWDRESFCYAVHEHALRVQNQETKDDEFLPCVFGADHEDDWRDEATWKKANPNYGVSLKPHYFKHTVAEAENLPRLQNAVKRLNLNIWTDQEVLWMPLETWDACDAPLPDLTGKPCWVGLDLSSRKDITAVVAVFKRPAPALDDGTGGGFVYSIVPRFFVPEEGLREREHADKVPYRAWVEQGLMTATPGNIIDYSFIRAAVDQFARQYDVREVAYDPWGATQLALELQDGGLTCVEFRQGFKSMSEPMKLLEDLVLTRRIEHGGNPVLRWMIGNVEVVEDAAGNVKPTKRKKSTRRIDGVVATLEGVGRASVAKDDTSPYETRGVTVV
jgi:phage terminase large subunit-like protein